MSAQGWFNQMWYGSGAPPWWLRPVAHAYGALAAARRGLYRTGWRRSVRLSRPVIVIGNLSVGGTGKTPLVAWLAARLAERGRRPGIVTRGYGGRSRGVRLVAPDDDAATAGDEPVLLARRGAAPVAAGRDRPRAAQLLIDAGCDVILSDDGLQHYALRRDCELVVADGARGFGNGWLLPAGPLREPQARADAADALIVNGGASAPWRRLGGVMTLRMRLAPGAARSLSGGEAVPLTAFRGVAVHAVAAIGDPERFFRMLRDHGIEVAAHPFDDHARLTAGDIRFEDDKPVLMTEKDAVKCSSIADRHHWYVPVEASFEGADGQALLDIVARGIAKFEQGAGEVPSG